MVILASPSCDQCGLICERRDLPHPRDLHCAECKEKAWTEIDRRLDERDACREE